MIVILDLGSRTTRAGFAHSQLPDEVFPTIVGVFSNPMVMVGMDANKYYVGQDALRMRGVMRLRYPIDRGVIVDLNSAEILFKSLFLSRLKVDFDSTIVLLSEVPLNSIAAKERTRTLLLEEIGVKDIILKPRSLLSLASSCRTSGVVLRIGGSFTLIVPIEDGYLIPHAMKSSVLSGVYATAEMQRLLANRGYSFANGGDVSLSRVIKEQLSYVSLDPEEEAAIVEEKPFELPDGVVVSIGSSRYRCNEFLFDENRMGSSLQGLLSGSLEELPSRTREELAANCLLTGGTARTFGLVARLEKELTLVSPGIDFDFEVAKRHSAWVGGKIVAATLKLD